MAQEDFLRRWSRRKREEARSSAPPGAAPAAEAKPTTGPASGEPAKRPGAAPAETPPLDKLTPESDFSAFMRSNVDPDTRNAALKKLFTDPRLNVIDPLDIDIDDYSKLERIPEAVVKTLAHARRVLLSEDERRAEEAERSKREDAGEGVAEKPAPDPDAAQHLASGETRDETQSADTPPGQERNGNSG